MAQRKDPAVQPCLAFAMRLGNIMLLLSSVVVQAKLDRTGRHPGPHHSKMSDGVWHVCVQAGGTGADGMGDFQLKYETDVEILEGMRTHVAVAADGRNLLRWPSMTAADLEKKKETRQANSLGSSTLPTVFVSGALPLDLYYEVRRSLARFTNSGTDLSLACSLPAGVQATAKGNLKKPIGGSWKEATCLQSLSLFRVAGPVNVEVTSLLMTQRFRLKIGRGLARLRCPISLQAEFPYRGSEKSEPPDYELGWRQNLDEEGKRRLRARILMPGRRASAAWLEYRDATIDENGEWIAKIAMPLDGGCSGGKRWKPEISIRREWLW